MTDFPTGWATLVLAAVAFVNIILTGRWRRDDNKAHQAELGVADQRRAREEQKHILDGLAQMEQILWFFTRRCEQFEKNSALRADALMRGFDAAMTRALADDMARALTSQSLAEQVYYSIFEAHDVLASAVAHQGTMSGHNNVGDPVPNNELAGKAHGARSLTEQAATLVKKERELLEKTWGLMLRSQDNVTVFQTPMPPDPSAKT